MLVKITLKAFYTILNSEENGILFGIHLIV